MVQCVDVQYVLCQFREDGGKHQIAEEDVLHGNPERFVSHCPPSTALDFTLKAPLERAAL